MVEDERKYSPGIGPFLSTPLTIDCLKTTTSIFGFGALRFRVFVQLLFSHASGNTDDDDSYANDFSADGDMHSKHERTHMQTNMVQLNSMML